MSTPIRASDRARARKLLQSAAEALAAIRDERLGVSKQAADCIAEARLKVQFAQEEIDAQPSK